MTEGQQGTERVIEELSDKRKFNSFIPEKYRNHTSYTWNFEDENKCAKLVRKCQNLYKYNLAVEEIFGTMELK